MTLLQQPCCACFRIEVPPVPGRAYGRFVSSQKLLEISPIVHELGIAQQVLLHEAVHAARAVPAASSLIGINAADPAVESRIRYLLSNHYLQEHVPGTEASGSRPGRRRSPGGQGPG